MIFTLKTGFDRKPASVKREGYETCGQIWQNNGRDGQHYFKVFEVYRPDFWS